MSETLETIFSFPFSFTVSVMDIYSDGAFLTLTSLSVVLISAIISVSIWRCINRSVQFVERSKNL